MLNKDLKNIVVLKNLPSNIIDEAIIILKKNKNAKKLQYQYNAEKIKNGKIQIEKEKIGGNEYIVKEAESVISNYIAKIEGGKKVEIKMPQNIEIKYKRMRIYSICISIITFICVIKNIY